MIIEAMKQALEFILKSKSGFGEDCFSFQEMNMITALRQAIEQAEKQELNAGGFPVKNATYWKRQYDNLLAEQGEKPTRSAGDVIAEKQGSVMRDRYSDYVEFYKVQGEKHA